MFVKELEGRLVLIHSDEFLGAFTAIVVSIWHSFGMIYAGGGALRTACSPAWSAVVAPCWAVGDGEIVTACVAGGFESGRARQRGQKVVVVGGVGSGSDVIAARKCGGR